MILYQMENSTQKLTFLQREKLKMQTYVLLNLTEDFQGAYIKKNNKIKITRAFGTMGN